MKAAEKGEPGKPVCPKNDVKGNPAAVAGALPLAPGAEAKMPPAPNAAAAATAAALVGWRGLKGEFGVVLLETDVKTVGVKGEKANGM